VLVAEEKLQPLALQDERIERIQDVNQLAVRLRDGIERLGPRPMLQLAGAVKLDWRQLPAAGSRGDQPPHRLLAPGVEMADGIQADDALRAQRAVQQVFQDISFRRRLRRLVPAEVPVRQLVGLQHPPALAHRHHAAVESELQRALGRFAAAPVVHLVDQNVVVDVADGECAVAADAHQYLAQVAARHPAEPGAAIHPVPIHVPHEEAVIARRHVGERVRPVLEDFLVHRLRQVQVLAPVVRDACVEDLVVAALDHVNGVDLHVAEVLDRRRRGLWSAAERHGFVEPLRAQPDAACAGLAQLRYSGSQTNPASLR
jgi:hypothetical protein